MWLVCRHNVDSNVDTKFVDIDFSPTFLEGDIIKYDVDKSESVDVCWTDCWTEFEICQTEFEICLAGNICWTACRTDLGEVETVETVSTLAKNRLKK